MSLDTVVGEYPVEVVVFSGFCSNSVVVVIAVTVVKKLITL